MNINATLLGQFIVLFAPLMAVLGYYLGRRATGHPAIAAMIGALLSVVPPLAIIYLVILLLRTKKARCET